MAVVGAGIVGAAAAWQLVRRGRSVVLLERFTQGHSRGSSHGSARIFRLAYPHDDYVRLAQAALHGWHRLEQESGRTLLTTTGGIDHGHPLVTADLAGALSRCGAAHELLPPEAAGERWPGLRFDGPVLFQPDAGRLHADAALTALHGLVADGADVRFEQGVVEVVRSVGGVEVVTASDRWQAEVAVVAVGAWAGDVLLGHLPLPALQVTVEQPAHFRPLDPSSAWPTFIHHRGGPGASGLAARALYGAPAMAEEGVKVGVHRAGVPVHPDDGPFTVDPGRLQRLRRYVEAWLPGLDPRPNAPTTCLYTTTPDEDFVVDRRGPLVVAAGFSGHGFKFAPAVGALLADLVEGRGAAPDRFRLPA
ncbi:MAG TPA: FAD-dependent oxidoreductase [Nitriliruptorales bacterium]|nr:FAD-dependent oxidoreductase [Nitriliruptorales bacterium]